MSAITDIVDTTGEDQMAFSDIEELTSHGIGMTDIVRLKQSGICTVQGVHMSTKRFLLKIKGFSEAKVDKLKEAASKMCPVNFATAMEISQNRKRVWSISTGSEALNGILGGGIQSMSITEVFGEFRCGKTQMSHTLCVAAQLPRDMGGAEGKVAFIDTEGTFRPDRIKAIAERYGLDPDQTMENIIVSRAYNSEQQMDYITKLATIFAEDGQYRLLIVDSIMALFRVDYSGRGELSERQQKLNIMLARLNHISEEFNVAVFVTNQVQADPGAALMFASNDRKPVGGHVMAHASATRLLLRKGRGEERVAKLNDSPDMPEAECSYIITPEELQTCLNLAKSQIFYLQKIKNTWEGEKTGSTLIINDGTRFVSLFKQSIWLSIENNISRNARCKSYYISLTFKFILAIRRLHYRIRDEM